MVNICTVFDHLNGASCPLCREPGAGFCAPCRAALPYNRHACARCALPLPAEAPPGVCCADCQGRPPVFDKILAPLLYQEPVDTLVADIKYRGQLQLGPLLTAACVEHFLADSAGVQLLLPIPMHATGLRERGFNQAAELASQLSRRAGIPWAGDRLQKVAGGRHQRSLNRRQRRGNVHGTFACRGELPSAVALIDDVVTTGATVEETARVAKRAGARYVEVWAIARTPRNAWAHRSLPPGA